MLQAESEDSLYGVEYKYAICFRKIRRSGWRRVEIRCHADRRASIMTDHVNANTNEQVIDGHNTGQITLSLSYAISLNRPSKPSQTRSTQTRNTTIRLSKTTLRSAGLYCIFPLPSATLPCDSIGSTPSLFLSPSHSLALNHSVPRVQPHSPSHNSLRAIHSPTPQVPQKYPSHSINAIPLNSSTNSPYTQSSSNDARRFHSPRKLEIEKPSFPTVESAKREVKKVVESERKDTGLQ